MAIKQDGARNVVDDSESSQQASYTTCHFTANQLVDNDYSHLYKNFAITVGIAVGIVVRIYILLRYLLFYPPLNSPFTCTLSHGVLCDCT